MSYIPKTYYTQNDDCTYCKEDKHSHSFYTEYYYRNDDLIFKTKVSTAKLYNNPESILEHINKNKALQNHLYWSWIIDLKDSEYKHYMSFNTVKQLSIWINEQKEYKCKNLNNIIVKNGGILIKPLILLAKLFLPKRVKIIEE
jgi:hypothetical protein